MNGSRVADELQFDSAECKEFGTQFPNDTERLDGETASADANSYEKGDITPVGGVAENVQASLGTVDRVAQLEPFLDAFADDRLGNCISEAFRNELEQDAADDEQRVQFSEFDAERLQTGGVGDESAGVRISGSFGAAGFTVPFAFAIQATRVGRSGMIVTHTVIGPDEPATDIDSLTRSLVDAFRTGNAA